MRGDAAGLWERSIAGGGRRTSFPANVRREIGRRALQAQPPVDHGHPLDQRAISRLTFYCVMSAEKYASTSSAKRSCPFPSTRVSETFLYPCASATLIAFCICM